MRQTESFDLKLFDMTDACMIKFLNPNFTKVQTFIIFAPIFTNFILFENQITSVVLKKIFETFFILRLLCQMNIQLSC